MFVYKRTEFAPYQLWTVGHYDEANKEWLPESDHDTADQAAARTAWLNGSKEKPEEVKELGW